MPYFISVYTEVLFKFVEMLDMTHKVFCNMALASLMLSSVSGVYAATTNADDMTCKEFLVTPPSAQAPVVLWVSVDENINSNGGSFTKEKVKAEVLPEFVKLCKKNPDKKVSGFTEELKKLF
jgi:acid stress chaperone HdeB